MNPVVTPFFHKSSNTWTYVVADPATQAAAVIDPCLDFDAKSGRTGVYDIAVSNQHGEPLAVFRGRSYTIKGKPLVEGLPMGRPGNKKVEET